jgi:pyridoxine 5-phosphate synthase
MSLSLGVNIDHIATLRNARGGQFPCPIAAALLAEQHGARGITAHLREDRRHIRDADIYALKQRITTRLNMEMAATPDMLAIALDVKPYMVTLVPERRAELTTEGGLDVLTHQAVLTPLIQALTDQGIMVSLFVTPDPHQLLACQAVGAPFIELHTGAYADAPDDVQQVKQLQALHAAALQGHSLGLGINAGHGLTSHNVGPIAALPHMQELNIGHSIMARAIMVGLPQALAELTLAMTTGYATP